MLDLEQFKVLIPLRGGSKGIPKKNIKLFRGKPLFTWCLEAALKNDLSVVVSSEDQEIKKKVKEYSKSVELLNRPLSLAQDNSSTEDVIAHFLNNFDPKYVILLQATSPLTTHILLLKAIEAFISNQCKPLVSGTKAFNFYWDKNGYPLNYEPSKRPRRQDWEGSFVENGAIYIFKPSDFQKTKSRCCPPCTLFTMPSYHAMELDNYKDWNDLENLAKNI